MKKQGNQFKERILVTIPRSKAAYVYLDRPNTFFATAEKPHGVFQTVQLFDPEDERLADLRQTLTAFGNKAVREMGKAPDETVVRIPVRPHKVKNKDTEELEDSGMIGVRAKANAVYNLKDPQGIPRPQHTRLMFFDAKKNKIEVAPRVGPGSVLSVGCEVTATYMPRQDPEDAADKMYVSLQLKIIQVIELHEYGEANPDEFGFEETEGYEAPTTTTPDPAQGSPLPSDVPY